MYKLSYEKCVCFVFLVILVFLSCSGFHTDRLVTLTDLNNRRYPYPYPFSSSPPYKLDEQEHERAKRELFAAEIEMQMDTDMKMKMQMEKEKEMNAQSPMMLPPRFNRRRRHSIRSRYRNSINNKTLDHKMKSETIQESPEIRDIREIGERRRRANIGATGATTSGGGGRNRRRKNEKRFCPGQDVGTRAFHAKIIIEGRVRSMNKNSNDYAVTVEVKNIYRNESNFRVLNITDMIRLHFAKRQPKRCDQKLVNGLVAAQLVNGKNYIFFLKSVGVHNYTVIGQPVPYDAKKVQQIRDVVHKKRVRAAKIISPRIANEINLKPGEKLNLTCIVRGNPPPIVTWYKDGTEIRGKQKRPRIKYMEKKSVLSIQSVEMTDAGRYECRAKGVIGKVANSTAIVSIQDPDPEGTSCDLPPDSFCLNGGTCFRHVSLGEYSCRCSNGFNGQRCEHKDVTSQTSTYTRSRTVYCKLGVSTTFYC